MKFQLSHQVDKVPESGRRPESGTLSIFFSMQSHWNINNSNSLLMAESADLLTRSRGSVFEVNMSDEQCISFA